MHTTILTSKPESWRQLGTLRVDGKVTSKFSLERFGLLLWAGFN